MKKIINHISRELNEDIALYNKYLNNSLESKVSLINKVLKYVIKFKGKQFRPLLCILSSKLAGKSNEMTFLSASTVEMLHVATLLHDDVVDESYLRRGWPTINKIWGNKLSILIGDYMFSKSLDNIASFNDFEHIKILSSISRRLSEGEILQIENAKTKNMSEDIYFKMISDKTASLISASCKLGYMSVLNDIKKNNLEKFGEYLGIAYQLKDDLFDVLGKLEETGKPAMLDLKRNMLTLPYIYVLNNVKNKNKILTKIKYFSKKDDFNNLKDLIYNNGGVEYTRKMIEEFSDKAFQELKVFNDSKYKSLLIDTIEFNRTRKS
ncbi:MAG: polyprenyl synthetase [Candidatus Marinimicrobia bacterium]|nr:polyprenyl synthetase [Candidatus Neomarinimicrobiota bacterium]